MNISATEWRSMASKWPHDGLRERDPTRGAPIAIELRANLLLAPAGCTIDRHDLLIATRSNLCSFQHIKSCVISIMPHGSFQFPPPNNETDWETICTRAMERALGVGPFQKFRRRGQKQHGIDLIATDANGKAVVVQCKLRNTMKGLKRADAEQDVAAAKDLIDDETGKKVHISRFVIATTDDANDHTAWAANVTREHKSAGLFEVRVYGWCDFRDLLNAHADLRAEYFGGASEATLNKILDAVRNPAQTGPTLKAKNNFADADIRWNRFFTGREADLARLHEALAKGSLAISRIIFGAGGVGKTELARAFALTFSDEYDGVWWIDASDAGFSDSVIRAFGYATGTPAAPDTKPEDAARELRALWNTGRHLVILDNLDSPARLSLFPPGRHFRVLATTRLELSGAATIGAFKVEVLSEDAAVDLLAKQTAERTPSHPEEHLRAIARAVDCHTLAVALAGAYLAKYRDVEARDYSAMLAGKSVDGGAVPPEWGENDPLLLRYYHSIRSCLSLHFDKFAGKREMVLLGLASFCAPTTVPLDVLAKATKVDIGAARRLARNLADLSIIEYPGTLSVHPLTQAVVRSMLDRETRDLMIDAVVESLKSEFDNPDDHTKWPRLSMLAAHADALVSQASSDHPTQGTGKLANELGTYLKLVGRYAEAQRTYETCIPLTAAMFGPEHPNMSALLSNLALVRQAQGDLPAARANMESAIAIDSKHFAPDHLTFAIRHSNLAMIQKAQGDLAAARASIEKAIAIDLTNLPPDHPHLAILHSNLALIQQDQGELSSARASMEKAIEIECNHLTPDHPTFATSYNNLAMILRELGEFAEASRYKLLSMEIERQHFGDDHPQMGASYSNLAAILRAQGDLPGARANLEKAVAIESKHFPPDHPTFATRCSNLALIQQDQGDLAGARASMEKAIAIAEKHLDSEHPHLATMRSNLAVIQQEQGDLSGARANMDKAIAIQSKHFAQDHTTFATSYSNLAMIQRAQGDLPAALASIEKAIAIDSKHLAPDHPTFAIRFNNLALIRLAQGSLPEARVSIERAIAIESKHFAPDHPDIGVRYTNLATICYREGDRAAACASFEKALGIFLKHFDEEHPKVKSVRESMKAAGYTP
ncbi:MAG: tetratricopeptide repeat protein [Planctomycetes bacterium]|nr:tetratricopeptide repeat protein [Planctomycetota bacterium]